MLQGLDGRMARSTALLALTSLVLSGLISSVGGIRCYEGNVTYCGVNADGGGRGSPNSNYYVSGMNWACTDQLSDLDPTTIAPNCWDQASCEALRTAPFDSKFDVSHKMPYGYVADVKWLVKQGASATPAGSEASFLASGGSQLAPLVDGKGNCPANHPACGLQTYLRRGSDDSCIGCYRRYRYSPDIAASYWNVLQVHKMCLRKGDAPCINSSCACTDTAPWYRSRDSNNQPGGECSHWAKAACRRLVYKCMHQPSDYVVTTFQDYDIKFCSIGTDDERCKGCVACTEPSCLSPVIPVKQLLRTDIPMAAILSNASLYTCDRNVCGEGPRTCWNKTCVDGASRLSPFHTNTHTHNITAHAPETQTKRYTPLRDESEMCMLPRFAPPPRLSCGRRGLPAYLRPDRLHPQRAGSGSRLLLRQHRLRGKVHATHRADRMLRQRSDSPTHIAPLAL